ncbi:MAG TPA: hypothetical protein VG096_19035 [Bryobacteraceae bacterium]|nr:hypothetical protein [Bryobacteraceae bacterium]
MRRRSAAELDAAPAAVLGSSLLGAIVDESNKVNTNHPGTE